MQLRRLQRQDEQGQWYDDAYAYEDSDGQVIFRYNLTWDRAGSIYNGKLQETGIPITEIETVFQLGERFRWLPIEVIADDQAKARLEVLDKQCAIPAPRRVTFAPMVKAS